MKNIFIDINNSEILISYLLNLTPILRKYAEIIKIYTVFDAVHSLLCLVPCEFRRISVFEKIFNKNIFWKIMPLNLLWTRFSYFCLFFLSKYDEIIKKKTTLQLRFWYKSCKFLDNFGKFFKIKNHRCLVPSRIWGSVGRLGGTRQCRIRYSNSTRVTPP